MRIAWGLAAIAVAVFGAGGGQGKKLGTGPYGNTNYESYGITSTDTMTDGSVTLNTESIKTINCKGCNTQQLYPGYLFHLTNNTKQPICASFTFKTNDSSYDLDRWGSGAVYYLKGRQTLSKIAGITMSFGTRRRLDMGWKSVISTRPPLAKNKCPEFTRPSL